MVVTVRFSDAAVLQTVLVLIDSIRTNGRHSSAHAQPYSNGEQSFKHQHSDKNAESTRTKTNHPARQ
jgi:hypothetical protein